MKKLLTASLFGTLLTITGGANASIVSRGFFEEQIGNYATLDLLNSKANQKDLTALNDIVGKENWDNFLNLKLGAFPHLSELFPNLAPDKRMPFENISKYISGNLTYIGAPNLASVTDKFLHGWTNSDGETYLGLKDINTKIDTVPTGCDSVGAALEAINAKVDNKITNLSATASNGKLVLNIFVIGVIFSPPSHWE